MSDLQTIRRLAPAEAKSMKSVDSVESPHFAYRTEPFGKRPFDIPLIYFHTEHHAETGDMLKTPFAEFSQL